jgi:protein-L-isoaspartate(D-aspartate) O-methyltransferase
MNPQQPSRFRRPAWRSVALVGLLGVSTSPLLSQELGEALRRERLQMVETQIRERGIERPDILRAFGDVPRHEFVPESMRDRAYGDEPLPMREGDEAAQESIAQPYLSARMIELLELKPTDRVLEIGTGSGYDAALISRMAARVYTIEIDPRLAAAAQARLTRLGYDNVEVRVSNGRDGWVEQAPFDAILLTTAPREVPENLVQQLEIGGRMVVPVGAFVQELLVITRTPSGEEKRTVMPIRVSSMRNERR